MAIDKKRIAKLRAVLARLKGTGIVQNRQLKLLLGADSYAQFEDEQRQQKKLRDDLKNKPEAVVEYAARLKKAALTYGQADKASNQGRRSVAIKLFNDAEIQLERLLEYLSEQLYADESLVMWFDRNIYFDANNHPSASPDNFPRVITSRSQHNRALQKNNVGMYQMMHTIKEMKIEAIEQKIKELTATPMDQDLIIKCLATRKKRVQRFND